MKEKFDSELPFKFGNNKPLTLETAKKIINDPANDTNILEVLCFLVDEINKLNVKVDELSQAVANLTPF